MSNAHTYVQLKFSRNDGARFSTGIDGLGAHLVDEAREMTKRLVGSCDYINVVIEIREGADTTSSVTHKWTRTNGWIA